MKKCTKCSLSETATHQKIPSRGSDHPLILFVGEAPGKTEDLKNRFFCGKAGKKLDEIIDMVGLSFDDCRWTNVVRCIPWNHDYSSFRKPTEEEVSACIGYLYAEIVSKDPLFIVPLGNTALHSLVPKAPNIGSARKKRFYLELPSTDFIFNKAIKFAEANQIYVDTECKTEKSKQKLIRMLEEQGFPHIDTKVYTIYPSYHPSAAIRGNSEAEIGLVEDLSYLKSYITDDRGIPFDDYVYCDTLEKIKEYYDTVRNLYRNGDIEVISIDLETNGLKLYLMEDPKVLLWSIAYDKAKAFSVPFNHKNSPFVNDPLALRAIVNMTQELLEEVPIANQNIKFDLHWLNFIGLDIARFKIVGDTYLSSWTIWQNTIKDKSLEALATRFVNMISHKEEMKTSLDKARQELIQLGIDREVTMDDIDVNIVHRYCCADTDSCLRLHHVFNKMMEDDNLLEPHQSITVPAILATTQMEINGIKCDLEVLNLANIEYKEKIENYYKELESLIDREFLLQLIHELKVNKAIEKSKKEPKFSESYKLTSNNVKSIIIFDILGFDPIKSGKTGPSVDKQTISTLMEQCTSYLKDDDKNDKWLLKLKTLQIIKDFNVSNTIYTRYINPINNYVDKNGIIHPNFGIRTTRTGRFTSYEPSFHQMPWKSVVKKAFIPKHEFGLILSADYSQMELRVLASLTGDENLIRAFTSGEDIHRSVTSNILEKDPEEVTDAERREGKAIVFGLVYGSHASSIAAKLNIPESRAEDLVNRFFNKYKKVKRWIDKQHKYGRKHGKVYTPFGFLRILEDFLTDNEKNNRSVNTPVQGGAADICSIALRVVSELVTRAKLLTTIFGTVHDSILFSVYPNELYNICVIAKKGMVDYPSSLAYWLKAPIRVDMECGASWGELLSMEVLGSNQIKVNGRVEYYNKFISNIEKWVCDNYLILEENIEFSERDNEESVTSIIQL